MQYATFGLFVNLPVLYKLKSLFGVTVALFNSAESLCDSKTSLKIKPQVSQIIRQLHVRQTHSAFQQ